MTIKERIGTAVYKGSGERLLILEAPAGVAFRLRRSDELSFLLFKKLNVFSECSPSDEHGDHDKTKPCPNRSGDIYRLGGRYIP